MPAVFLNSGGGGNVRPSASRASIVASGIAPPSSLATRGQAICDTGHTTAPETPTEGCRRLPSACPCKRKQHTDRFDTGGTFMGAPVVWFEVAGRDFDTLSKFYTELFHWKVNADNPIGYGMVETGGGGGVQGGIFAGGETEYVL